MITKTTSEIKKSEKYKNKIMVCEKKIEELRYKIDEITNSALKETGTVLPYIDHQRRIVPGLYDDAQWYHISTEWDCEKSPIRCCMYHIIRDQSKDSCVFCGQPKDRK